MSLETLNEIASDEEFYPHQNDLGSAEFVAEALLARDVVDTEGVSRPAYTINGHEVVFRTRQESPTFDDSDVMVPGGESVYPVEHQAWDETTGEYSKTDESAVRAYVDTHQEVADRMVVTNTPEGILLAAALLAESTDEQARLQDLAESFSTGRSWTDDQREALDTILAAVSVNDKGEVGPYLDMSGWALALAALSGNTEAKQIVDAKRAGLVESERVRASDPTRAERLAAFQAERGIEASEPIPLEQLALVHSTSYEIQRDEDGSIILRSAGQQREDKLPRASLHFTLNSRVGSVIENGTQHDWDNSNKLIVANLKKAVDESRTLPNRMAGMDTWFTLNPGEALKLPGALLVERVEATPSGEVVEVTDSGVLYVEKDDYTTEEKQLLYELGVKYKTSGAMDVALRIAMERVGVPVELMDNPSDDGHGMFSNEIGSRVDATATMLGLPGGKHFESPEAHMESEAFYNMPRMLGKLALGSYELETEFMNSHPNASLEARRQTLASGYYPARPNVSNIEDATLSQSSDESVSVFM